MGQHAAVRHEPEAGAELLAAGIVVVLAEHHRPGAAAGHHGAGLVGLDDRTPAAAAGEGLAEVAWKAAEQEDQARLSELGGEGRVLGRGAVNHRERGDVARAELLEPVYAVLAGAAMIVVGRGRRGDDADRRLGASGEIDGPPINLGHQAAELAAALEDQKSGHDAPPAAE